MSTPSCALAPTPGQTCRVQRRLGATPTLAAYALLIGILAGCKNDKPTGPVGRYAAVGAVIDDGAALAIVGGAKSTRTSGPLRESWRLDLDAWEFSAGPTPPFPTCRGIAAPLDGALHVVGGSTTGFDEHAAHWRWDTAADTWTTLDGTGPGPRFKHGGAVDPATGRVFLVGGRNNDSGEDVYFGDLWVWQDGSWTEVPTTGGPHGIHRQVMVWDADRALIWVHAGFQPPRSDPAAEPQRSDRLWSLDPETGAWEERTWTDGPPIRASHAVVLVDGELVVWGGNGGDSSTWVFDPETDTWTEHAHDRAPLPRDAMVTYLLPDGRTMVLVGGDPVSEDVPNFVMDAWTLDTETMEWTERVGIE
jgi:hypothetical protein